MLAIIADEKDARLPIDVRASLIVLAAQLKALHTMIGTIERRLIVQHRADETSKRASTGSASLAGAPLPATVTDARAFRSGRDFAAWIGLAAQDEATMLRERCAFAEWRLEPRSLVDVSHRTLAAEILGRPSPMPVVISPTGLNGIIRAHGDIALA